MATFLSFAEGRTELANAGLPATCHFALSTKSVGGATQYTGSETLVGAAFGEITGTGYARQTESEPTAVAGLVTFATKTWSTGAATDWPAAVRSVCLCTGAAGTGKLIAAWDLQASSAPRDLSSANTTENMTVTLQVG